jgi:predicted membrane channel-forming protein YqfA (hemolysin III family)
MRQRGNNGHYYENRKRINIIIFIVYLILGVYFINFPFQFYPIPEFISKFDNWIIFAGGIFMLFGAINYFRVKRNRFSKSKNR